MTFFDIFLIGLGLSMDAAAVTIGNTLAYAPLTRRQCLAMPLAFGLFQGLMPLLGTLGGSYFAEYISRFAGPLAFVILGFIGGKMLWDGIKSRREPETNSGGVLTARLLLVQAVATSIDAFAVGVTFAASDVSPLPASLLIAATTFCCILLAVPLGRKFGALLGGWAQMAGGVILILIGVRSLL